MLTVLRDAGGQLQVACEWWLVDDTGQRNHRGRYVWVEALEGHLAVHDMNIIRQLSERIAQQVPQAVGAYWIRRHKTGERAHGYRRRQLVREGVGV